MKKLAVFLAVFCLAAVLSAAESAEKNLLTGKWQLSPNLTSQIDPKTKDVTFTSQSADKPWITQINFVADKPWITQINFVAEAGATYVFEAVLTGITDTKYLSVRVRFNKDRQTVTPVVQPDKSLLLKAEFTVPADTKRPNISIWRGKPVMGEKAVLSKYSVKKINK